MISGGINIKKLFILIVLSIVPFLFFDTKEELIDLTYVNQEIDIFDEVVIETPKGPYTGEIEASSEVEVIKSYYGPMTAYGPDCVGCIGITSSGYNVLNGNIYYHDDTYGNIRIVAADKSLPFGTIIRISGLDVFETDVLAIVLDRGSAIGFGKKTYFDLLYNSEKETEFFGKRYATFDILRLGY